MEIVGLYHAEAQIGILTIYSNADFTGDIDTRRPTSVVVCQ